MGTLGCRDYHLSTQPCGAKHLISPVGESIAVFFYPGSGGLKKVSPMFEGLDCGVGHKTTEEAISYVARQHELLTTTGRQRLGRCMFRVFAHPFWVAIAAIAAIIVAGVGLLNYFD